MKIPVEKMEKLGVKGHFRNLGLKWLTRLVHTQNIETAKQLFAIGVRVFGFEHKCTEFKTVLEELNSVIAPDDILEDESLVETKKEEIDNELFRNVEEEKVGERHGSPFHKLFYDIFKVINEKETANEKEKEEENPYYSKEFFEYLLEYLMPYFPMWSAVVLCYLGLTRDSNAVVENYFKWVKCEVWRKKMKNLIPRYIIKAEGLLEPKLLERELGTDTERQKKQRPKRDRKKKEKRELQELEENQRKERAVAISSEINPSHDKETQKRKKKIDHEHDELLATETWKKKSKSNRYFIFPKFICKSDSSNKNTCIVTEMDRTNDPTMEIDLSFGEDQNKILSMEVCPDPSEVELRNLTESSCLPANFEVILLPKRVPKYDVKLSQSDGKIARVNINKCFDDVQERFFDKNLTYPKNFENMRNDLAGVIIDKFSLSSLKPNFAVDDNVINGVYQILSEIGKKNDMSVLSFDIHFTTSLMQAGVSTGFKKWSVKMEIWKYNVWLIPVHSAFHWTLLVIIFPHKRMFYIDSLHGNPPLGLILAFGKLIDSLPNLTVDWEN